MMATLPSPPSQAIVVEARSAPSAVEGCAPIPGFSSGDVDRDARYLLLGILFGTNEFEAEAGNVICALSSDRALTVALPFSPQYSAALSAYLADRRGDADTTLAALPIWDKSEDDGRNSAAMFRLIQLLRRLRLAGRGVDVAGYWPSAGGGDDDFHAGMADQLKAICTEGRIVVAVMAATHAAKTRVPNPRNSDLGRPYLNPAGSRLPADQVISIRFEAKGGMAWGWLGLHHVPSYGGGATLWSRYADTMSGYDGRLFIGSAVTASQPEKQ